MSTSYHRKCEQCGRWMGQRRGKAIFRVDGVDYTSPDVVIDHSCEPCGITERNEAVTVSDPDVVEKEIRTRGTEVAFP